MALSQVQCLDDNHVNLRTSESKPEFLYCEDQRLALEALLQNGREAFFKYLDSRRVRGFLSDPEMTALVGAAEPFDPGSELVQGSVEDESLPLSLHYWPDLSDISVPQMDLGWPSCDSYRGVTRTSVYTQPPLDGHAHIKEVVRKMIAQAQKVIAVVMDIFTDADIFRDLLDAGFKRKVSVYILLERTALPHFLSMCQRAGMHAGHLKHLRVRCSQGAEFFSRHCMKVRGQMGHRFMFIDGDKAVSGSYSFTWMSSRLDRNLITVITGQAVEGFDKLFCSLYVNSSFVELRQVATEPEPEPDFRSHLTPVVPPSATVLRKLHNPKYALVALTNPGVTVSTGDDNPKETEISENKKKKRKEEARADPPALHPGLINLEKASLIAYLPTWPEPDPPRDVIGFINIRDVNKPLQVHLQRSEMFGTSQAIRFSSPFSTPEENVAEITIARQFSSKQEKISKEEEQCHKPNELMVDKAQAELHSDPNELKSRANVLEHDKDESETSKSENKVISNANSSPKNTYLGVLTIPQSNRGSTTLNKQRPLHKADLILTNEPNSASISDADIKKEEKTLPNLTAQSAVMCTAPTVGSNSGQWSQLPDSNTAKDTLESALQSQVQAVNMQLEVSSEITPNPQTTNVGYPIFTSSASNIQSKTPTCVSKNNSVAITSLHSSPASILYTNVSPTTSTSSLSKIPPTSTFSSSAPSFLALSPSIPKRHTVELVMKDSINRNDQTEICLRRPETSLEPQTLPSAVETRQQTSLLKKTETVLVMLDNVSNRSVDPKSPNNPPRDQFLMKEQQIPQSKLQTKSDCLVTGTESMVGSQESIPIVSKTRTGTKTLAVTNTDARTSEVNLKNCKSTEGVTECHPSLAKSHKLHRVSCSVWTSKDNCASQDVDILKAGMNSHNTTTTKNRMQKSAADMVEEQEEAACSTSAQSTDHGLKDAKANTLDTLQTQENTHHPRKSLQFSDAHQPDLLEAESQFVTSVVRISDELPWHSFPPDPKSYFQTPTYDLSDEPVSPRRDSTQSTTSEEYYECSGSPLHDSVDQNVPDARETKDSTADSEGRKPKKASPARRKGLRTSSTERAETQPSTEADRQKFWHPPPKAQRPQQLDRRSSPSSRQRRTLQPLTASQLLGVHSSKSLNQTEFKMLPSSAQITDITQFHRRAQSRSPSPGPGRGPVRSVSPRLSQHSLSMQQPPAAQTRGRAAQPQSHTPYPKPKTSFLHTYLKLQKQVPSQSPKDPASPAQKKLEQEEKTGPPDVAFSRLDSLKGLKDKMSKLSAQSKMGSTISAVKTHGGSSTHPVLPSEN
uniref:Scaffolding anchor of CK1 domain-containing protein n=1 Tax=Oryzias sinensis TaxID=183150 RepID=A0A8C7WR81_9TELE